MGGGREGSEADGSNTRVGPCGLPAAAPGERDRGRGEGVVERGRCCWMEGSRPRRYFAGSRGSEMKGLDLEAVSHGHGGHHQLSRKEEGRLW